MQEQRDDNPGPLAGLRVLELGSTVAGPFCGRLFADFGAEVIKVEMPEGDPVRTMGSSEGDVSLYAASIFRNKLLIAVDLRSEEGRGVIRQLALRSDILIENFRPGAMEKWGLGWDALRVENPRLIMIRISGFGQTGPASDRAGYGVIGEAVSGLRHVTGAPDRPPARLNTSLGDYVTGLYAAFGALVALQVRQQSGQGQLVDAALYECAFSFMEPHVPAYQRLGVVAQRTGSALPGSVPNNLYTAKDGRPLHITAMADSVFRRLCQAMGREELAADRFGAARVRIANAAQVDEEIQRWTGSLPLEEVEAALLAADVPATRIFTMADIFADAQYRARGMLASAYSPELKGEVTLANVVPRLGETPGRIRHAGKAIGADTRSVLQEVLRLSPERIDELVASQVVRTNEQEQ